MLALFVMATANAVECICTGAWLGASIYMISKDRNAKFPSGKLSKGK